MNPTVQIDVTTAADYKGLFQTIIVRRFKNTIGIRYDMVQTSDILQFNSRAVLFSVADNYVYVYFPETGIYASDGEKFKSKKASQQAAAEIGIKMLKAYLSEVSIPHDQGESIDQYSSQTGVAVFGSVYPPLCGQTVYELVNKRDWKGQLQTSLLRKFKGAVEIKYTFSQNVRTDEFEATVILCHSDPSVGSCEIIGSLESTKKASEKTAAEKACLLIDRDELIFTPQSANTKSLGANDYSTINEAAQDKVTALKGLFGNNYKSAPSTILAVPVVPPTYVSGVESLSPPNQFGDIKVPELYDIGAIPSVKDQNRGIFNSADVHLSGSDQGNIARCFQTTDIDPISSLQFTPDGAKDFIDAAGSKDVLAFPFRRVGDSFIHPTEGLSQELSGSTRGMYAPPLRESPRLSYPDTTIPIRQNEMARAIPEVPNWSGNGVWQQPQPQTSHSMSHSTPLLKGNAFSSGQAFGSGNAFGPHRGSLNSFSARNANYSRENSPIPVPIPISIPNNNMYGRSEITNRSLIGTQPKSPVMSPYPQSNPHHPPYPPGQGQIHPSLSNHQTQNYNTIKNYQRDIRSRVPQSMQPDSTGYIGVAGPGYRMQPRAHQLSMERAAETDYTLSIQRDRKRLEQNMGAAAVRAHGRDDISFQEDLIKVLDGARSLNPLLESSMTPRTSENYPGVYSGMSSIRQDVVSRGSYTPSPTHTSPLSFIDRRSDSKSRVPSFEDELNGLITEKKATDWKGELQTFLARNCKDYPFKIEYNSEERVAGGKFVARVTITFDNKEEENRVVHGIPAVNKKTTERTAAGIALEMFHQRVLSIPRFEDNLMLQPSQSEGGDVAGWDRQRAAYSEDMRNEKDSAVKDWKGRLQMLLARRYRGVFFKICYDAPKSVDGIFKAFLMIIPQNVNDLDLKICEGKSSRVKKISEQSVAEAAVRMLENDTLEVPSPSTEKYKLSAIQNASDDFSADLGDEWLRRERVRRSLEQRKPKRSLHSHSERNDHGAYFMQDSSFLFMKDADILSDVKLIIDNESECAYRNRKCLDRAVPILFSDPILHWKEDFVNRLVEKFHSQLESVTDALEIDTFKVTVNFGRAYFMNTEVFFEQRSPIVNVREMQEAMHIAAKNRVTHERTSFTLEPPNRDSHSASVSPIPPTPSVPVYDSLPLSLPHPYTPPLSSQEYTGFHFSLDRTATDTRGNDSDLDNMSSNASQCTGNTDTSGSQIPLNDAFSLPRPNEYWPATHKDIQSAFADDSERDVDGSISARGDKEKRVEKKKKGISSGFRSSVFPSKICDPSVSPHNLDSTVAENEKRKKDSAYETCDVDSCFEFADAWLGPVLSSLGYEESDGIITDGCQEGSDGVRYNPLGKNCTWQVKVIASTAYQVDVRLTSELQIVAVTERPLCWVYATLLSDCPPLSVREICDSGSSGTGTTSIGTFIDTITSGGTSASRSRADVTPFDEGYATYSTQRNSYDSFARTSGDTGQDDEFCHADILPDSYVGRRLSQDRSHTSLQFNHGQGQGQGRESNLHSPRHSYTTSAPSTHSHTPTHIGMSKPPSYGSFIDPYGLSGKTSTNISYSPTTDSALVPNIMGINLLPPPPKRMLSSSEMRESMLKGHDTRIKLFTAKSLSPGDPLYDAACPLGSPPITKQKGCEQPFPSTLLKIGHKIVFAKNLLEYKIFKRRQSFKTISTLPVVPFDGMNDSNEADMKTSESSAALISSALRDIAINYAVNPFGDKKRELKENSPETASNSPSTKTKSVDNSADISVNTALILSKCRHYEGDSLEDGGAFVDLTLEVDCCPLITFLNEKNKNVQYEAITREKIDIWFKGLFDHIASLSESIETSKRQPTV